MRLKIRCDGKSEKFCKIFKTKQGLRTPYLPTQNQKPPWPRSRKEASRERRQVHKGKGKKERAAATRTHTKVKKKYLSSPRAPRRALSLSVGDGNSELQGRGHRRACSCAGGRSRRRGGSERCFLNTGTKPYRCCNRGGRGYRSGEEDAPRGAVWDASGHVRGRKAQQSRREVSVLWIPFPRF